MSLKERVYSVLVVSATEKMNTALSSLLSESRYEPVRFVTNISAAKRIKNEQDFDYIIINSPLPDDTGIRFAIDCAASAGTVVLLLVRAEVFDDIYDKVVDHGVFIVQKPLSPQILTLSLRFMESARERLRTFEEKTLSFEEKMQEIRIVNRAKLLLISELRMDEPQAHRYIEKQAMDSCISKRAIAEEIIKTYS